MLLFWLVGLWLFSYFVLQEPRCFRILPAEIVFIWIRGGVLQRGSSFASSRFMGTNRLGSLKIKSFSISPR